MAEVEEEAALSPQSTRDAAMAASLAAVMLTFAAACVTISAWVAVAILVAFAA